jgi:hypothetical protein
VDVVPQRHRRRSRPIVDTWWQTETGGIMISPLPGVTNLKPGSAQRPSPASAPRSSTTMGEPVPDGHGGYLVLTKPWPAMLRGIWGDPARYVDTYWSRWPQYYFAGDGAKKDEEGNIWLLGRVDDVMNVSGHRLSTTEIESALVSHPKVAEAAVVGANDEMTGQAVVAFVILRAGSSHADDDNTGIVEELRNHVAKEIGPIAKPKRILIVPSCPRPARCAACPRPAPARSCAACCATYPLWRAEGRSPKSSHSPVNSATQTHGVLLRSCRHRLIECGSRAPGPAASARSSPTGCTVGPEATVRADAELLGATRRMYAALAAAARPN